MESREEKAALNSLKEEVATSIGLKDKLDAVGGDTGALTPRDYGYLGGQMSSRLTALGKNLYKEETK